MSGSDPAAAEIDATALRAKAAIGEDDLARTLAISSFDGRASYSVVGDIYTIVIPGEATDGRYAVIDMHVPPGGGPDPHRHACEEMFMVVDGEVEIFFRDGRVTASAGSAVNIPANAPHMFKNRTDRPAHVLNVVAPAGLDAFFVRGGIAVPTEAAPPPPEAEANAQRHRMADLAVQYGVDFLPPDTFRQQGG